MAIGKDAILEFTQEVLKKQKEEANLRAAKKAKLSSKSKGKGKALSSETIEDDNMGKLL